MKTFDKKDVFTCLNAEDAKVYIGKEGYLADSLYNLRNAIQDNENTFELETINDDSYYGRFRSCDSDYMLFLPADKVKEV